MILSLSPSLLYLNIFFQGLTFYEQGFDNINKHVNYSIFLVMIMTDWMSRNCHQCMTQDFFLILQKNGMLFFNLIPHLTDESSSECTI